ncbi:hypothetical protein [Pollutibacter soli]|uniref:hypothetical protein n=1 Tax=Pollutibacter soli TaxID=3034157 RepID=UPI003013FDC0
MTPIKSSCLYRLAGYLLQSLAQLRNALEKMQRSFAFAEASFFPADGRRSNPRRFSLKNFCENLRLQSAPI